MKDTPELRGLSGPLVWINVALLAIMALQLAMVIANRKPGDRVLARAVPALVVGVGATLVVFVNPDSGGIPRAMTLFLLACIAVEIAYMTMASRHR